MALPVSISMRLAPRYSRRSLNNMARKVVAVILVLWLGIAFFVREPGVVFMPLYGFFPGEISFWGNAHPARFCMWAIVVGLAFLALGLFAIHRDSKPVAAVFVVLLLLSTVLFVIRYDGV